MKTLNAAMVAALGSLRNTVKNAVNPHFRNRYATLDAILDDVRPVLAAHGLALSQEPLFEDGRAGVLTRIIHEGGETRESILMLPLKDASAQGVGSALSYARRYAAASVLGIASDDDEDGNMASRPQGNTPPPKKFHNSPAPAPTVVAKDSEASTDKVDYHKILTSTMTRDKVDYDQVFGFLHSNNAKIGDAEYIGDLSIAICKRLIEVWDQVKAFVPPVASVNS